MTKLVTSGWKEWVTLDGLGLPPIKAKMDTGAKSSALHVEDLEIIYENNQSYAMFKAGGHKSAHKPLLPCKALVIDQREIINSGGKGEIRYVIKSLITLGSDSWPIEITLTNRKKMRYPMLIGRTAMIDRICVNPAETYLLGHAKKRKPNENCNSLTK